MNYGPSLEGLEFTSDNEEEIEPIKNSSGRSRKRTINAVQENADLPPADGILFIYNP
jgi:DNA polymerase III delta subunit